MEKHISTVECSKDGAAQDVSYRKASEGYVTWFGVSSKAAWSICVEFKEGKRDILGSGMKICNRSSLPMWAQLQLFTSLKHCKNPKADVNFISNSLSIKLFSSHRKLYFYFTFDAYGF